MDSPSIPEVQEAIPSSDAVDQCQPGVLSHATQICHWFFLLKIIFIRDLDEKL